MNELTFEQWMTLPGKKNAKAAWEASQKDQAALIQAMRDDMAELRRHVAKAELKIDELKRKKDPLMVELERIVEDKIQEAFGRAIGRFDTFVP